MQSNVHISCSIHAMFNSYCQECIHSYLHPLLQSPHKQKKSNTSSKISSYYSSPSSTRNIPTFVLQGTRASYNQLVEIVNNATNDALAIALIGHLITY